MGRPPKNRLPPEHTDKNSWYWRTEVARLVNLTREGVRHLESKGTLHPVVVDGEWRFDPLEIDRYVKARADLLLNNTQNRSFKRGEIAAHAFSMFEAGKTRRDVVMRLKIEPEHAQRLWEQYQHETFEEAERAKVRRKEDANDEVKRAERRQQLKALFESLRAKK